MLSASLKGNKDITNKIANRPKINKSNLLNEYFLKLKKILWIVTKKNPFKIRF